MQPTIIRDEDIRPTSRRLAIMPPRAEPVEGLHVNPVDALRFTLNGAHAIGVRLVVSEEELEELAGNGGVFWFVTLSDHLHPLLCTIAHPLD